MITHEEANELLASYALDAVMEEEQELIETHLSDCPRCRAELDALRDVAASMGNSVEPLPDGLWASIASRLPERQDSEPPPMPRLVAVDAPGRDKSPRPTGRRRYSQRSVIATVGAFAVAAAAVAAVLGIGLVRADNQVSHDEAISGMNAASTVEAALTTKNHQVVNLESSDHVRLAQFVLVPDGRGYLVSSKLKSLPSNEVYQLWGIIGNEPISLGLMGHSPKQVTFTTAGPIKPSRLSITVEPAGGTVVPGAQIASGVV
jgi:anti-sigma-K factor RskA